MNLGRDLIFIVCAVLCYSFFLSGNEIPFVYESHLPIAHAQEQEIPPVAPTVPQTPTTQSPNPQNPAFNQSFSNNTESTQLPLSDQQWQTYENLSDGIHIDYPATWEKTQEENNLIFLAPPDPSSAAGSIRTGVGIIQEPSLGVTLDAYVNKSSSDLFSRIPGSFVVLENVPLPGFKQGIEALKSVYQWDDPPAGGLVKAMETYLVSPDRAYTITYAAPTISLFDKYLPLAQKMIDSFQPVSLVPAGQGMTGNATQLGLAPFTNATGTVAPEVSATYQNPSFGSVQYPSNWETMELGGGSVAFHAPLLANESIFPEEVGFLKLDTLPNPNESIDKFFSDQLNNFKNTYTQYTLAEGPSATTINGNPAIKARFTHIENNIPYETLEIWTTNQDKSKAFQIEATSKYGLYPSFPSAHMQRIIDSFQMAAPLSPPVNNNNSALQGLNTNTSSQIDMQSGNFLTYSNSTSGVTVQYPSNWGVDDYKAVDPSSGVEDLVKFYPLEGRAGASDTIFVVSVDPYVGKNISANEYLTKSIEYLGSFIPNFKLVDSKTTDSGVMLSGSPAYQAIYTGSNPFDGTPLKGMEVGTILNGKAYFLTYDTSPSKFDSNLSTIKKLMESFRLSTS